MASVDSLGYGIVGAGGNAGRARIIFAIFALAAAGNVIERIQTGVAV